MQNDNTLAQLVTDAAAFAAAPLSASADTATALLFRVDGAEQATATAVVDIAYGVLMRRFNGIDKNSIGGGRGGRLKNYHTTANSLQKAGYSFGLQASWLAPLRNAGKLSTWGQSVKNALAALESLQLIAAKDSSSDSSSDSSGEITTALSDADRAGKIAAELVGAMSPEVFDILAAAVDQRMAADTAAQARRDVAAAEKQAAADIAAAAAAAKEASAAHAARVAELRRAADAADLAAIAADQAAKQPGASAAAKKRAAKLLKAAQVAGAAYQAAIAA